VLRLFVITRLDSTFRIVRTRDEALAAVRDPATVPSSAAASLRGAQDETT
jgi:hypothetical protein